MSNASAKSGLSFKVGMIETRLALPQRSPSPLSVPWICRAPAGERIVGIGLVAVEEVLAVEQNLAAFLLGGGDAVADRGEVLPERGLERDAHVIIPRFGDEAD